MGLCRGRGDGWGGGSDYFSTGDCLKVVGSIYGSGSVGMWREDDGSSANRCCDWVYVGDIESAIRLSDLYYYIGISTC